MPIKRMIRAQLTELGANGLHVRRLMNLSWTKSAIFSLLITKQGFRFLVFRKTTVCIRDKGRVIVENTGRFAFNEPWLFSGTEDGTLIIGEGATLSVCNGHFSIKSGAFVELKDGAKLTLRGGGGYASRNLQIESRQEIDIGASVAIGPDVIIRDNDGHSISPETQPQSKKVTIGDRVWIGARATILKGVHIGDGSVIAAGSIVTTDIPPRSLAAGTPASVIRENVTWS